MDTNDMLQKLKKIEDYLASGKPTCEGVKVTESELIDIDDLLEQIVAHWEY